MQLDLSFARDSVESAPSGPRVRLRYVLGVPLLLVAGGIALLMPARHGLMPLWPSGLEEVVYADEAGVVHTGLFEVVRAGADGALVLRGDDITGPARLELEAAAVRARSRPLSAAVVVDREQRRRFAYLSGVRAGPETSLESGAGMPVRAIRHDYGVADSNHRLLLRYPDGRTETLPSGQLLRHYRPNRMSLLARLRLFASRFAEHWSARTSPAG